MTSETVVVLTASTRQGAAAVYALRERGRPVRALVRSLDRPTSQRLAGAGAELVAGGLDDVEVIREALEGAAALFLAQPGHISPQATPGIGPDDELRRGRAILDLAADAAVGHVVFSSALSANRADTSPLLRPKTLLEQHLRTLGLRATILRPVGFMENYTGPARGLSPDGVLTTTAPPDVAEQLIAVRDIGRFVADAVDDPTRYVGMALDIACDERTPPEIAAAISRSLGREIRYEQIPLEHLRHADPRRAAALATMYGPQRPFADLAACRALVPDFTSFDAWLDSADADPLRRYLGAIDTQ
jgi:uncharacterized protein YbjT (DUF2867 family)